MKPSLGLCCSFAALLCAGPACRKAPPAAASDAGAPAAAPASAAASAATAEPRCQAASAQSFTIGRAPAAADAGEDDEIELPFAVEIGSGVALDSGFAASALRAEGGGTSAVVALLGKDGRGRLLDLGRVHGSVDPPGLAASRSRLVAAVPDGAPSGRSLRLAALRDPAGAGQVVWGATLEDDDDESGAFALAVGEARAVIAWDGWDAAAKKSVVRLAAFDPDDPSKTTRARNVSPARSDAELPRLLSRKGGFWLGWIAQRRAEAPARLARPRRHAAGARDAGRAAVDEPVVPADERWVEVVPLDANGAAGGEPLAVTPKRSQVEAFDLGEAPGGELLVAWRQDEIGPNIERGRIEIAVVRPDGAVEHSVLDDEDLGAGAPALLVDAQPPAGGTRVWLALASASDATRLGSVGEAGAWLDEISAEPAIGAGQPLAADAGRLLVAHPRGLAVELGVVACRRGAPRGQGDAAGAGAAPAGQGR